MPLNAQMKAALETAKKVARAAKSLENVNVVLEDVTECVYVKGPAGKLIAANSAYTRLFGRGQSTLGRDVDNFLDATTLAVASLSDQIILAGSPYVVFEHQYGAGPAKGSAAPLRLCTVKVSLLNEGIVNYVCLGLTRVLGQLPPVRRPQISQAWQRFEQLDTRSQELAILLALGKTQTDMAAELDISPRTVSAEIKQILDTFEVDDSHGLSRLLVRVQDAGFADWGL